MNAMQTTRRPAQWMAGTVALLAALLTLGGSLLLAEHYAQAGAGRGASGYDAAERSVRAARGIPDAAWPAEPGRRRHATLNNKT